MSKYVFTNHYYAVVSYAITRNSSLLMVLGKQEKVGILLNFRVSSLTQASLMINKTYMYVYGVQKRISMSYQFPLIKQNNPTQNIRINVEFILIIPIHNYLIIPY